MLFAAGSEPFAVGSARSQAPVQAIRVETNDFASGNAHVAPVGTCAHAAGHAVTRATSGAGNRRQSVVDLPVAIVIDSVASLGRWGAAAVGSDRRRRRGVGPERRFGKRRNDRSGLLGVSFESIGVEPRATTT